MQLTIHFINIIRFLISVGIFYSSYTLKIIRRIRNKKSSFYKVAELFLYKPFEYSKTRKEVCFLAQTCHEFLSS